MLFMKSSRSAPQKEDVSLDTPKKAVDDSNVNGVVLKEALQDPAFMFPVAIGVPVVALGVIALTPWILGVGVTLALGGGCRFIYKYVINGEKRGVAIANDRRLQRRRQVVDDFGVVIEKCKVIGFAEGADAALKMKEAYSSLLSYLTEHQEGRMDQFRFLAEDTFKQGSATISLAFDLFKAINSMNPKKLNADLANAKRQAKVSASVPAAQAEGKVFEAKAADLEKRLALVADKQEKIDELLAKVSEIESQLQETHLELVELGQQDPTEFLNNGGAVKRLKSTVEAARTVEARLRGEDPEQTAREQSYASEAPSASSQTQN